MPTAFDAKLVERACRNAVRVFLDEGQFYFQLARVLRMQKRQRWSARRYCAAARHGHARTYFRLGVIHTKGEGVTKNQVRVFSWFLKSARQGHDPAQTFLAANYSEGQGVTKNNGAANTWYRKAVDQVNSDAQNSLGVRYRDAIGFAKIITEAAGWFRNAAHKGHSIEQNNLGKFYYNGTGGPRSFAEAYFWFPWPRRKEIKSPVKIVLSPPNNLCAPR